LLPKLKVFPKCKPFTILFLLSKSKDFVFTSRHKLNLYLIFFKSQTNPPTATDNLRRQISGVSILNDHKVASGAPHHLPCILPIGVGTELPSATVLLKIVSKFQNVLKHHLPNWGMARQSVVRRKAEG
jgi:hypothetical protein